MNEAIGASAPTAAQTGSTGRFGRGQSFRLVQPRNLASWVFVILVMLGALETYRYFRTGVDAVGTATTWGFIVFAIYALPWLWFLRMIDRWTKIPAKLAGCAWLWGAFAATFFIAIPGNGALMSIYTKVVSPAFAEDWGAALAAPFSEEIGKGVGIILLMAIAPRLIRTPFDGFIVGAFVGLGFQVIEDVLYVVNSAIQGFGADQAGTVLQITIIRGLSGLVSHTFYSGIVGAGLVFLFGTSVTAARRGFGTGLILLSILIHGVWDAMGPIGEMFGLDILVLMVVNVALGLALVVLTLRRASATERAWVREIMEPEVTRGTISLDELDVIAGSRRDRRRYLKAAGEPNRKARKATRRMLDGVVDLATALSASGGHETPVVQHARSEVVRLRQAVTALAA